MLCLGDPCTAWIPDQVGYDGCQGLSDIRRLKKSDS